MDGYSKNTLLLVYWHKLQIRIKLSLANKYLGCLQLVILPECVIVSTVRYVILILLGICA